VSYSRRDIHWKEDAINAQAAAAYLFFLAPPGEFPPAESLPVFGLLDRSPVHRAQMNVFPPLAIYLRRREQEALME
jgi:hypothetical protein